MIKDHLQTHNLQVSGRLRHHIIGTGRWGTWLTRRLHRLGFEVASVRNRTVSSGQRLAKELGVTCASAQITSTGFERGDIVWCCVGDAQIEALHSDLRSLHLQLKIVHCSGTTPLLTGGQHGVFWPIQSITASTEPDWANLPIVVQASTPAFAKTLLEIASKISGLVPTQVSTDEDRMRLHLGAVMTQNFSNLLWRMTEEVLAEADLDYKSLLPLAKNHLEKLASQSAAALQTGPAMRNDQNTLDRHQELLKAYPDAAELYRIISAKIAQQED